MRFLKWGRMILLSYLLLLISLPLTAYSQSSSQNLVGTAWQGATEASWTPLNTWRIEFKYLFVETGKARAVYLYVISGMRPRLQYNAVTGESEWGHEYSVISTQRGEEVCTYKRQGRSIQLECPQHSVSAAIQGNRMEGEITVKPIGKKAKWVVERILRGSDDKEQGVIDFGAMLKETQDRVDAASKFLDEAETFRKNKRCREAIGKYTQAINLAPAEFETYLHRGDCKLELQEYRGAIADYDLGIQLYSSLQNIERAKHRSEGGIDFGALLSAVPAGNAYYNRGTAKYRLGDKIGACQDFHKSCSMGKGLACDAAKRDCN